MKNISRRKFLKFAAAAAGGALVACTQVANLDWTSALAEAMENELFLPLINKDQSGPVSTPTSQPTFQPTPVATTALPPPTGTIIADHTVVDAYQNIPQQYIDQIKKMWVDIPGESHSEAYRTGCVLLESVDNRFQVNVTEGGTPEGYTDQHMRISRVTWGDHDRLTGWIYNYGEEDWYTSPLAIQRTKDHLTYCNTNNLQIAAMGFGWCWDMTWINPPGGTVDPVYQVRWSGSSAGGSDGNKIWGLDAGDLSLTQNSVCMDHYLSATLQYMAHCQSNNYPTKVFFSTGPVDNDWDASGEGGYQRHLKHEYIRNFVKATNDRYLFDYADILSWSDSDAQNTLTWTDHGGTQRTYPFIHNDNLRTLGGVISANVGHIGERGALRLGKALWWMLARMAGWEG
jgi:hypothetical protein